LRRYRTALGFGDLLRAAVVFLHGRLEDLIRSLLEWKLPDAPAQELKSVPLTGLTSDARFTLQELAVHRGKSVHDVIRASVSEYLLKESFNNPGQLLAALDRAGLPGSALVSPYRRRLAPMMRRRHWIVHRADRNEATGSGHHSVRSLGGATVRTWLEAVRAFGADVLKNC
jgi:hypothetical protein